MKKLLSVILALSVSAIAFAGCGAKSSDSSSENSKAAETSSGSNVIKVGASSTPHAEILEHVKDALKEKGYELDIVVYDDYVLPNKALADGELDVNYFQHTPYLNSYNKSNGTDIVSAGSIHYEPFGLYGKDVKSISDIKPGAQIVIPADDSNETRALLLLQQEGLIKLPDDASAEKGVTTLDIVDDGGYKITTVQADTVAAQFQNGDSGSLAVINGNYALAAGLKIQDALAAEDSTGDAAKTYANIVAVRKDDLESEKTKALVSALQTDDVKKFLEEKYNGAVAAVF